MILVTGGLGFIGSHTVRALTDAGQECVLLQRRSPELPDHLAGLPVHVVQADAADLDALLAVGEKHPITGIVHLPSRFPGRRRRRPGRLVRPVAGGVPQHRARRAGLGCAPCGDGQHHRRVRRCPGRGSAQRGPAAADGFHPRHPDVQEDHRAGRGPSLERDRRRDRQRPHLGHLGSGRAPAGSVLPRAVTDRGGRPAP
ncbi:NAD-dependent epimerase/dehydratase family protein [Kineosporia succinea]